MLGITADNVPSNDTMMAELGDLIAHFGGEAARTRCFLHIINLVTKSLIKQFNLPKRKGDVSWQYLDDELKRLEEDIALDNYQTGGEFGEDEEVDKTEGLVNELDFLTDNECAELMEHLKLLHLMLAKVSKIRDLKDHIPLASWLVALDSQIGLQNCSFEHQAAASMECYLGGVGDPCQESSTGCGDPVEFHI